MFIVSYCYCLGSSFQIHFKDRTAKAKFINFINNYLMSNETSVSSEFSDESEKGDNTEGDIWSYYKVLTQKNIKKTRVKKETEIEFHIFMSSPVTPREMRGKDVG